MREVFGGYGIHANASLLMERRQEGIPNDIARLEGAREVTASETRDGCRLNAALIKSMLGGEPVTARYLQHEFFEFMPQFLVVLSTNHKPVIDGADFGLMRRLHLVPFEVRIPEEQVDPGLAGRLRTELPGVLAWLVQGCVTYQRDGLMPPAKIKAATAEYGAEMDTTGLFLEERVEAKAGERIKAVDLYGCYLSWAVTNSLRPLANPAFNRKITERLRNWSGVEKLKSNGCMVYTGLALKPSDPSLRPIGIFGPTVDGSHVESKGLFGPIGDISAEKVWAHQSRPNPCRYR